MRLQAITSQEVGRSILWFTTALVQDVGTKGFWAPMTGGNAPGDQGRAEIKWAGTVGDILVG